LSDRPVVRATAQNPDVFFQNREAVNRFYLDAPGVVQRVMSRFAALTGRHRELFEYDGAPDAERVIVIMGSGAATVRVTVARLGTAAKVGVLRVKLYRPFSVADFVAALPPTVRGAAVLDHTNEAGALGEPLYQDVVTALAALQGCRSRVEALRDGRTRHLRLRVEKKRLERRRRGAGWPFRSWRE